MKQIGIRIEDDKKRDFSQALISNDVTRQSLINAFITRFIEFDKGKVDKVAIGQMNIIIAKAKLKK